MSMLSQDTARRILDSLADSEFVDRMVDYTVKRWQDQAIRARVFPWGTEIVPADGRVVDKASFPATYASLAANAPASGSVRYPWLAVNSSGDATARNLTRETPLGRAIDWTGGADTD